MPASGEPRVLSPGVNPSEEPRPQPSKGQQSRVPRISRTISGSSTNVPHYRQTTRSASSPSISSRANPAASNPSHAAKFKDIVNKFNETPDEKIPCPTNATAASRMSPSVKIRKAPEPKKTATWKSGGGNTKPMTNTSAKARQNRSTSALSQHESKAISRASSRASTPSTPGDTKSKRSSSARSVEKSIKGDRKDKEDVLVDGDFIVQGNEKRLGRSQSNIENDKPKLSLRAELTTAHRRSRSNTDISHSPNKKPPPKGHPLTNGGSFAKSKSLPSSAGSSLSSVSPPPKILSQKQKHPSSVRTTGTSPRNYSSTSAPVGHPGLVGTEPTSKKSTLTSSAISPHSSRHISQPSKSPTLRAYVTAPPPKKSPPLRSSRPRAQISTSGVVQKQKPNRASVSAIQDSANSPRSTARMKKKIPELGSIDFAARRAAIQAAYTRTLGNSIVKESQPKVIVKEPSAVSLKGPIEAEDEKIDSPSPHRHKEVRPPPHETIQEEHEEEDGHFDDHQLDETNVFTGTADTEWDQSQLEGSLGSSSGTEAVEDKLDHSAPQLEIMGEPLSIARGLTDTDTISPTEPLPQYEDIVENSSRTIADHCDEKQPFADQPPLQGGGEGETVRMAESVEMVERPASKRFSLSGLPSLRYQIDNLPKQRPSSEDSPLSPFTRSLLTVGEPINKSTHVPLIVTPDSHVEPRRPPPRLADISQFLRPDSVATTAWTDVSYDERSSMTVEKDNEPDETEGASQAALRGFTVGGVMYPADARSSLSPNSVSPPIDSEIYSPTDGESTILSFIDRYDEPREDFLSPYIDSPSSEYTTTITDTDRGSGGSGEDGCYEGDEDELSSCSSGTIHSSSRPSAEGSDDWRHDESFISQSLSIVRPQTPESQRKPINQDSPLPPTPPPKDDVYLPPVPRKDSVPFVELGRKPGMVMSTPNRTPQKNAVILPEIPMDGEPLGLAIRISSPILIGLDSHNQEHPSVPQKPNRPSLENMSARALVSLPSSYNSDPDGSRRSSSFTLPLASPRTSETVLPSSLSASIRIPTMDSTMDQKVLMKRKNIIKELLDTEKVFFQDMTVTEEIYKGSANACPALTPEDVKVMFCNTDAIVQFSRAFQESLKTAVASVYILKKSRSNVNSSSVSLANSASGDENIRGSVVSELSFLSDDEKDRQTRVGEAFGEHLAKMEKVYGDYCKNHEAAVARLQKLEASPGVAVWLRECKAFAEDLTNAWSLDSLLIKPVQRILKYPLLLHSLLGVTPSDHPDYPALVSAEKEIKLVADRINELKKRKDILEKIVRKRNDTDIRHGISKLITRRAEMLRQTMGASEAVVDPMYNKLVENFNMHFVQLQVIFRDIDQYIAKTNEFFEQFLEITGSIKEFQDLSQTRYPELESKWRVFDTAMRDMVKLAGSEHTLRVKKHCVEPIETLLRMFDNPQRLMEKRNKKSVDFARYNAIKEKGTVPDKKTKELADAYVALNEALIDELPKLFSLTKKLVIVALGNFVDLQSQWSQTFSGVLITGIPDLSVPKRQSDIIDNFSADYTYNENCIRELGICNGKTIAALKAITSPLSLGNPVLSPSSISLEEKDLPSHHRPNTADPIREQRERGMSFSNRSVSSLDNHRRHSGEMTVTAAMSTIATAMPGASHMVGQTARARASSSVYPTRVPITPGSPSVLRSLSAHSPLTPRAPTSHPRPPSATAFAPVPETTLTPDLSRASSPSPHVFSGAFSSALPMSDSEPSPGPSRSNSRQSSRTRRSESRRRPMTVAQDSSPLFVAVSLYEFNIDKQRREAGFPYLTYVQGEVFDVIGIKGEIWLAKNQDDTNGEIGWIWCKHFQRLP